MTDTFSALLWVVVLWFTSMYTVEFAGHVARDYQVKELKEFVVQQIADNGGYTSEADVKVKERMEAYGLDDTIFKISLPSGRVDYQEKFDVVISGSYTYRAFNLLGSGIGNFTVPIKDIGTGVGQVYYR